MDRWNGKSPFNSRSYRHHFRLHKYKGVPNQYTWPLKQLCSHVSCRPGIRHQTLFVLRIPKGRKRTLPTMHRLLQSMFSFLLAYEQSRPAINEYRPLFNSTINFYCCILKVSVFVCFLLYTAHIFVCFLLYIVHIWLGRRKRPGVPVIEGQQRSS